MNYRIFPPEEILETTVENLPLSKSISARALVLNALTDGSSPIDVENLANCNDTNVIATALRKESGDIYVADCGTAARFLTAYFAAKTGIEVTISGTETLNHRPIAPLVDALRQLGGKIDYLKDEGCLPIHICGQQLSGGEVKLNASASSQFASAIAMIAPTMLNPLRINLGGEIASMPYLNMTLAMMRNRGIESSREGYTIAIDAGKYHKTDTEVEPDWSAAAFWYEIAAVSAGWITLPRMLKKSLQGDSILSQIGERFGVLTEFTEEGVELSATPDLYSRLDLDMSDYPDLVPALSVVACMINIPFVFTGIANLRHKESDRIEALVNELRQCGWLLQADANTLSWEGDAVPVGLLPRFSTHGDHRLAMALAPIAYLAPGIIVCNAEVVEKSYPDYWTDLQAAGFTLEEVE